MPMIRSRSCPPRHPAKQARRMKKPPVSKAFPRRRSQYVRLGGPIAQGSMAVSAAASPIPSKAPVVTADLSRPIREPRRIMQLALSSLGIRLADMSAPLMQPLVTFWRGLEDGWLLYMRYAALARLSDHDLAGRGIARRDIPQAALRYVEEQERP